MRKPFSSDDKPVIDPRWHQYLDTSADFLGQASVARPSESPHEQELRELMATIITPWQNGRAASRETLIRLRRLADLQL